MESISRKEYNHDMKTLEERLDGKIKEVYIALNCKLDKTSAIWIVGVFVTIMMSALGYIVYETRVNSVNINGIKTDVAVLKNDVSNIKQTFSEYNIIIKP